MGERRLSVVPTGSCNGTAVTNDISATTGMYDIMQYTSPGGYRS